MPKKKILEKIKTYWNRIKIIGIFVGVLSMIIAAKTYINYNTIIEAIEKVEYDIHSVEYEIAYANNFLKNYLDSEYSDYFLAHKNNILFNWEFIIKFQSPSETEEKKIENKNIIQTPQESRQHFIRSKIKK